MLCGNRVLLSMVIEMTKLIQTGSQKNIDSNTPYLHVLVAIILLIECFDHVIRTCKISFLQRSIWLVA